MTSKSGKNKRVAAHESIAECVTRVPTTSQNLLCSVTRDFAIYDAVVNENATKQQYHWLNEEKESCCTCGTRFNTCS